MAHLRFLLVLQLENGLLYGLRGTSTDHSVTLKCIRCSRAAFRPTLRFSCVKPIEVLIENSEGKKGDESQLLFPASYHSRSTGLTFTWYGHAALTHKSFGFSGLWKIPAVFPLSVGALIALFFSSIKSHGGNWDSVNPKGFSFTLDGSHLPLSFLWGN